MLSALAMVAVVLAGGEAVFVDTSSAAVVRRAPLGGRGVAVFCAPDGRVLVPLADEESTAAIDASGRTERWSGRVFPLFVDEPDRFYTVLPGWVMLLSYPERLPLRRFPIAGLAGAWRGACSANGQLVAIVPLPPANRSLVVLSLLEGGAPRVTQLSGEGRDVVVGPFGEWVAVALEAGAVEVVIAGDTQGRGAERVEGEVLGLAVGPDPRDLLVAVAAEGRDKLLCFRISSRAENGLRRRFETPLAGRPAALAVAGDVVMVASEAGLEVLARKGRAAGQVAAIPGAQGVAVMPQRLASALPSWSDEPAVP